MQFGAMESILPTTTPDSIDDAAEIGFDGLELRIAGPYPGDDPAWTPEGRTRIRRRGAERGIGIPSICLGFLNHGGLTSNDPDVRADTVATITRAIDAAAALGADTILVPFFGTAEIETDRHRDRVVNGISEVADAAEAAGVTLAIEATLPAADVLELLDRIDSPAVGNYYDVGNATGLGYDPAAEIRELGDQIAQVHFKDRDAAEENWMIGEGDVDFPACVEALREIGYDGWIVLETARPNDPFDDAATNLSASREYVQNS